MVILLLTILVIVSGSSYINESKFKILTGMISVSNGSGSVQASYPAGFAIDNCVVISAAIAHSVTSPVMGFGANDTKSAGVQLYTDHIKISSVAKDGLGPTGDLTYKIVLMKV